MTLTSGTRLGPYEILSPLGAGGMGEVYKARDTRLDRTVAIKVLPPHVLSDPSMRARFEREARSISALDHPNICVVHDVGREGDLEYIVMQYVEGETLAARLARGPLPLDEALRYGTEIAAALDKAHRAGILHRDLKPGNVMLSKAAGRDTSTRLLDFGLAKVLPSGAIAGMETVPATAGSPLTGRGAIVGTLMYMSPEQLQGTDVDARSDIFSFGALLYEMVTGRRAFDGTSQASIIGGILEREPQPIASVMPLTPPALDRVVRKCLAKDRDRRWQSAGDLCDELSWIAQSSGAHSLPAAAAVTPAARTRTAVWPVVAGLALLALGGLLAWKLLSAGAPVDTFARHLNIVLPDGLRLVRGGIALSPDGRTIVFTASAPAGTPAAGAAAAPERLYVRAFNAESVTAIPGTEGGYAPFFSPDGQSVGYFTTQSLWTVSLRGGPPVKLVDVPPVTRGGVWMPDGSMIVAPTQSSGLARGTEGEYKVITAPDEAQGEKAHIWPQPLPGRNEILFTIRRGTANDVNASDVAVLNVATNKWRVLLKGCAFPQYSPTGHLLCVRGGTLSAAPFDLAKLQVTGTLTPVAEGVSVHPGEGGAHYAVGPDGTLLFMTGAFGVARRGAEWVDRTGKSVPAPGISGVELGRPRISPDGLRVLFDARSADADNEVYIADLSRGTPIKLSDDPADDFNPAWTPDGRRAIWTALPAARLPFLVMRPADGTGRTEEIVSGPPSAAQFVGSVSKSNVLAYTQATAGGARDIWVVPLEGDRKARPFLASSAAEFGPEFSPDGAFIAYVSAEAGVSDVYVAPYPGPGEKRRVTTNGAVSPVWSRDGKELFYQTADRLMVVDVIREPALSFGAPRQLFTGNFVVESSEDGPRAYDVSPDGKRFLMLRDQSSAPVPLVFHALFNWTAELKNAPHQR